ncbi:thiamine-phosphate kinase [Formivibrio citricus]|uniref:Thiamine-monophosphate kinase n=1 Tax=Formivibrio citricus TaxID=83765 RepID=A0A1I4WBY7_9NEIS|nr:thiamine-phosphate kinase [Formivibrio citricus]SFN10917.1 thiamine-phosphate kinase [Formivibrio citricus]
MNEFGLIARYFDWPAPAGWLGVGDDAALVPLTADRELAVSVDMMIEGRHFFADADPGCLARKALAVNLSDMAAMGAEPKWFTLSLALPEIDVDWLGSFSLGLREMADEYGVVLVGGDTTRGPLAISIQIAGEVPAGQALLRSGGKPGDDVWVSGPLGAAAAAVMHRLGRVELPPKLRGQCEIRLDLPVPRVQLGVRLRGLASAALDISDGLVADLGHICERSGCGAEIMLPEVPYPRELDCLPETLLEEAILAGGDDYELCFTAPAASRSRIEALGLDLGMALARIGSLTEGDGVRVCREDGLRLELARAGFDHFS